MPPGSDRGGTAACQRRDFAAELDEGGMARAALASIQATASAVWVKGPARTQRS